MPGPALLARVSLALLLIVAPLAAYARDITLTLRDDAGRPVSDAVVTIEGGGRPAAPGRFTVSQRDMTFTPYVLLVPVGSTVEFANLDPYRHHVYSFSPAKRFELKLFGRGEKRSIVVDRPGVVALGCNIHDTMQAFIAVVNTPFADRSNNAGRAVLHDVPAGPLQIRVWHPLLRAPGNLITVPAGANVLSLPVRVRLRAPTPMMHGY